MTFGDQTAIRCVFMRGGTSRGAFLRGQDLPRDDTLRDRVILALYGSPDERQIDGLGGADPLTSKVAIVEPSTLEDVDVDYTFGQVEIAQPRILWKGNCGNMLSGVAAFAVDEGLVRACEPITLVRIRNTNTNKVIRAEVPVVAGRAKVAGDCEIAGVPGRAAPIALDFGDCSGAVTGALLPTGRPTDVLELAEFTGAVSIVDAATPFVFVRAADVGLRGSESPDTIAADRDVCAALESIRGAAARLIGLVAPDEDATAVSPSVPRVSVVAAPSPYETTGGSRVDRETIDVIVRQMAMQRPHRAYSVTGSICTAVAAHIRDTVVHHVCSPRSDGRIELGHPGGVISVEVQVAERDGATEIRRAALLRTARRLMDGMAYVPSHIFGDDHEEPGAVAFKQKEQV